MSVKKCESVVREGQVASKRCICGGWMERLEQQEEQENGGPSAPVFLSNLVTPWRLHQSDGRSGRHR